MAATGVFSPLPCQPQIQERPPPTSRCSTNFYFPATSRHRLHHQRRPNSRPPPPTRCHHPSFSSSDSMASNATSPFSPLSKTPPSSMTQDHFVKAFNKSLKASNHDRALYLLEIMVSIGHRPCEFRCTQLIKGLSSSSSPSPDNLRKVERVMEIVELHGCPTMFTYRSFLKAVCRFQHVDTALSFLPRMRRHGCPPDTATYNILISALCYSGRLRDAFDLLHGMPEEGTAGDLCKPSVVTYTTLIEGLIAEGFVADATGLLEELSARGIKPNDCAYNAILKRMCKEGHVDQALQQLRNLPKSSAYPDAFSYDIVLKKLLAKKRFGDAWALVREMVSLGGHLAPTVRTYNALLKCLCEDGMVEKAVAMLGDMVRLGVRPSSYSLDPVIAAYCKRGRMDLALAFVERMAAGGCMPGIVNFNTLLYALCKKGKARGAIEVLRELELLGYKPTSGSYNALIEGFWACGERRMALELVEEMAGKGVAANDITYNVLVSCLCGDGLVDEAMDLVDDMDTVGLRPSVIAYNNVLLGLCKAGRVAEAIDVFVCEMLRMGSSSTSSSSGRWESAGGVGTARITRPNCATYDILVQAIASAGYAREAVKLVDALIKLDAVLPG